MPAYVQQPAPDFKAPAVIGNEIKEIKLSDLRGSYVHLFFYPLDFSLVCPTEIVAYSDRIEEFKKRSVQVIGVSVDSQYSHLAWKKTDRKQGGVGEVNFPMVADLTKQIARDYGVLIESKGYTLRGSFIIDKSGIVRHITICETYLGRGIDEILRIVNALQHFEKHGEMCPTDWEPGGLTIKPQSAGDYFNKANK